jgi:1-acyl-sn-glycerol-3-phosphate acyltransferase
MRSLWYLIVLFCATMFYGMTCIIARYLGIRYVHGGVYDWCQRHYGRSLLSAAGVKVTVEGGDHIRPGEPEIIAANHTSYFDILAFLGRLPVDPKFVAKKELFRIPVFGGAIRAAGHVRIDRQNLKEAFHAYEEATAYILREKLHVLVYPEGTRTRTGELLPFKKGPFVLAIACQVPVVPAYVHGAFRILPKGSIIVRPHPIRIVIGDPVPTTGMTYEDRDRLAAQVREAMLALKARAEAAPA